MNDNLEIVLSSLYQTWIDSNFGINKRLVAFEERCDEFVKFVQAMPINISDPQIIRKVFYERDTVSETSISKKKAYNSWYSDNFAKNSESFRAYKKFLEEKGIDRTSINYVDDATTAIMNLMEDPNKNDAPFSSKGLVYGEVQSGKTQNYIGLIHKAIDSGYDYVIILAGMTNDLRKQTQERVSTDLIGSIKPDNSRNHEVVGIGKIFGYSSLKAKYVITDSENDYSKKQNIGRQTIAPPAIAVVKKNAHTLNSLIERFESLKSMGDLQDKSLLIIDDEADQASVNTNDVRKDSEISPTAINRCIRKLLTYFEKNTYVGYTATPYANIFIPSDFDEELDVDLFPSNFIFTLKSPEQYTGHRSFYDPEVEYNPLICKINSDDIDQMIENYSEHPEAEGMILQYLVSATIKYLRYIKNGRSKRMLHASLMFQITHKNIHQDDICASISDLFNVVKSKILSSPSYIDELEKVYNNMIYVSKGMGDDYEVYDFKQVMGTIVDIVERVEVKVVNGESGELTYDNNFRFYILVGGFKLSRGLTIEGLVGAVYGRRTKQADTLNQMGRWFGYRKQYLDLIRIYISKETLEHFEYIHDINVSIVDQIAEMLDEDDTPENYRLYLSSRKDILPTDKKKMRYSDYYTTAYKLSSVQTTKIPYDDKTSNDFIVDFIKSQEKNRVNFDSGLLFMDVDSLEVAAFLENYYEMVDYSKLYTARISPKNWARYIREKRSKLGELTNATIVVKSLKDSNKYKFDLLETEIIPQMRSYSGGNQIENGIYKMKVVTNTEDEAIGLENYDEIVKQVSEKSIKREAIRNLRDSDNFLLIIYPIYYVEDEETGKHKIMYALALSFPDSAVDDKKQEGKFTRG